MRVLGIETSCDETAAAVVEDGARILSNVVVSQIDIHRAFGGVVPEVAARSHIEAILPVIDEAVRSAASLRGAQRRGNPWDSIDAIAVSTCPGLVGSLMIGTLTARALALTKNIPLYPVNHVEAHVYANFLEYKHQKKRPLSFPLLALIVSGGHTQIVLFRDHGDYDVLGATRDDAVGEAFDKVAKILGLPYPGGPSIAKAAVNGNPDKYRLPKARLKPLAASLRGDLSPKQSSATKPGSPRRARDDGHSDYDFSFSGLKTALLRAVQAEVGKDYAFPSNALSGLLTASRRNDFAASFQKTACETLCDKIAPAYAEFHPKSVVIAGGVAANAELRRQLSARLPIDIAYAPPELCTDNAAMVAGLGYFMAQKIAPADPREVTVAPSVSMEQTKWGCKFAMI